MHDLAQSYMTKTASQDYPAFISGETSRRTEPVHFTPYPSPSTISGQGTKIFVFSGIIASVLTPFPIHYTVFAWEEVCNISYPLKVGGKEQRVWAGKSEKLLWEYFEDEFRILVDVGSYSSHSLARHPKLTEGYSTRIVVEFCSTFAHYLIKCKML